MKKTSVLTFIHLILQVFVDWANKTESIETKTSNIESLKKSKQTIRRNQVNQFS